MDNSINVLPPSIVIKQAAPQATAQPAPEATPLPAPTDIKLPIPDSADALDANALQAVEQKRGEAVERAAREVTNTYVISDKTFTIFKDITGQYITRFTSLRDGKVTYIPEPELLKSGSDIPNNPVLSITA